MHDAPVPVPASVRALELLLSRALSFRPMELIVAGILRRSITSLALQLVVDGQVFVHQAYAAVEREGRLLR